MIQNYQPTFLQNLLGKHYKWWYLFWYEFKRSSTHWTGFIFSNFFRITELLVAVFVWVLNSAPAPVITYLALGHVFVRLSKSPFGSVLGAYISNGSHTKILIRPQNVFLYYFFQDFGFNQFRLIFSSIIALVLSNFIFGETIIWKSESLIWLISFWPLAIAMRFFCNFILGSIAFWVTDRANNSSITEGVYMFMGIMAGEIIPLSFIFKENLKWLEYNPFAYFLHLPMQIYLGKYDNVQIIWTLLGGIAWCIILYILAKIIFKLGLKRNESVGL
jgi:ABC-2 type transport system permease protein